jgi:hypothetical protein
LVAVMAGLVAISLGGVIKLVTPPGTRARGRSGSLLTSAPVVEVGV